MPAAHLPAGQRGTIALAFAKATRRNLGVVELAISLKTQARASGDPKRSPLASPYATEQTLPAHHGIFSRLRRESALVRCACLKIPSGEVSYGLREEASPIGW